jgi:hypothetical protein
LLLAFFALPMMPCGLEPANLTLSPKAVTISSRLREIAKRLLISFQSESIVQSVVLSNFQRKQRENITRTRRQADRFVRRSSLDKADSVESQNHVLCLRAHDALAENIAPLPWTDTKDERIHGDD